MSARANLTKDEMFVEAVKEILTKRQANGIATSEDELKLAVNIHIEQQINAAMLELFYKGEVELGEQDGEMWVGLTEKAKSRR